MEHLLTVHSVYMTTTQARTDIAAWLGAGVGTAFGISFIALTDMWCSYIDWKNRKKNAAGDSEIRLEEWWRPNLEIAIIYFIISCFFVVMLCVFLLA